MLDPKVMAGHDLVYYGIQESGAYRTDRAPAASTATPTGKRPARARAAPRAPNRPFAAGVPGGGGAGGVGKEGSCGEGGEHAHRSTRRHIGRVLCPAVADGTGGGHHQAARPPVRAGRGGGSA